MSTTFEADSGARNETLHGRGTFETSADVREDVAGDGAGVRVLSMLTAEHARLQLLLSFIERRCAALEAGDDCEIEPALDAARYVQRYLSAVHRPKEDVLIGRAFDASDPARRGPGTSAHRRHRRCDDSGARFLTALTRAHNGEVVLREEIVRRGAAWIGQLRALIRSEEHAVYRRAAAGLGLADWRAVRAASVRLERRRWHRRFEQDLHGFERHSERREARLALE